MDDLGRIKAEVDETRYMLWRFRQSRLLIRKDVASIVKLPAEELKDILEQVARVRVSHGWQFLMDYDREFTDKHPDIVQRQNMLWDAKYQQLVQQFKISKEMEKKLLASCDQVIPEKVARRRTSSRSKSKSVSDSSDAEDHNKMDTSESTDNTDKTRKSPKTQRRTSVVATETNGSAVSFVTLPPTMNSSNSESLVVDFVSELTNFVKEKMYSRYVLTLSDLRRLLNVQISNISGGKIKNPNAISDELLEHTIQSIGGAKLDNQWPSSQKGETLYALVKTGDKLDEIRTTMFQMFTEVSKMKISALKTRVEAETGKSYQDVEYRRILKDYCTTKGSLWHLKLTT